MNRPVPYVMLIIEGRSTAERAVVHGTSCCIDG